MKPPFTRLISFNQATQPLFGIILLHGLCAPANELAILASRLSQYFGNKAIILQPSCRASFRSIKNSTENQTKNIFHCIQSLLLPLHKPYKTFPLFIIGYSHGGVVACMLGNHYGDQLNIQGIITLNAPLAGVPLLQRNTKEIRKFILYAQKGLKLLKPIEEAILPFSQIKRNIHLWAWLLKGLRYIRFPLTKGVQDLYPHSICLKKIHTFLYDSTHTIPCLLIGSYHNDFRELFKNQIDYTHREALDQLNEAYAHFVTGKREGLHDTLIPLDSQLCRAYPREPLAIPTLTHCSPIKVTISTYNHIKGYIYKGISHASNLIALDLNLFVDPEIENVYNSHRMFRDIVNFIKENTHYTL